MVQTVKISRLIQAEIVKVSIDKERQSRYNQLKFNSVIFFYTSVS